MDNWVIEAGKIIAGATLGVLLTEFVPAIKSFFKKKTLSVRNNMIHYYRDEYLQIKAYKDNQTTLIVEILRLLAKRLLFTIVIFTWALLGIIAGFTGKTSYMVDYAPYILGSFLGIVFSDFNDIYKLIDKVKDFDKYKEKTNKILSKWGASLDGEVSTNKKRKQ